MAKKPPVDERVAERLFEDEAFLGKLIKGLPVKKQEGLVNYINVYVRLLSLAFPNASDKKIDKLVGDSKRDILKIRKKLFK